MDVIYVSGRHVYKPNDVFNRNYDGVLLARDAHECTRYVRTQSGDAGGIDPVIGFDMEGDMSCLMIGEKRTDGGLNIQHCVYGDEAEALYRALNMVPALQAALQPRRVETPPAISEAIDILKGVKYESFMEYKTKRVNDAIEILEAYAAQRGETP